MSRWALRIRLACAALLVLQWPLARVFFALMDASDAVSATGTDCPDGGDNSTKSTQVDFPDRGRWVVEAETLEEDVDRLERGGWGLTPTLRST